MPDFLGLLLANPALYVEAGNALEAAAAGLTTDNDTFTDATSGMPSWHGDARTAQDAKARSIAADAATAIQALRRAGQAAVSGGTELITATNTLRDSVDLILAEGYLVIASGLVVIGPAQEAQAAAATVAAETVIAAYEAGAAAYTAQLDTIIEAATAVDEETAAQIEAAGGPIGVTPPDPSPLRGSGPPVTVRVAWEKGMPLGEFTRKADALLGLSDRGMLYKAHNPVARDKSITDGYRSFTIGRIRKLYNGSNPTFRDSLIDNVANDMSPDHRWELQLGGPDRTSNLGFLHRFTNERIGLHQIWPKIMKLPDGTPIRIEVDSPA